MSIVNEEERKGDNIDRNKGKRLVRPGLPISRRLTNHIKNYVGFPYSKI